MGLSDERRIDLSAARADGWYERVVAGFSPLEKLANRLGDGLVALALAGGFRIATVQTDKLVGTVVDLRWWRESSPIETATDAQREPTGDPSSGPVTALRTAVLAALVGEAEPPASTVDHTSTPDALRSYIGPRTVLLAPLFGLSLNELRIAPDGDARVVVSHDGIEETVALKQLRRFLRQRVVEVLQADAGRGQVAIELTQADLARTALDEGRPEEAVARLVSWLAPLTVFHRTAEGQALDRATRARLARALGTLAEAFGRLRRVDERQEVLRLSLQYALDGDAAPMLYLSLASAMVDEGRHAEAIGPLRRALALGGEQSVVLPLLGLAYVRSGRATAALGCLRALRAMESSDPRLEALERELRAALGSAMESFEHWMAQGIVAERTATMPAFDRDGALAKSPHIDGGSARDEDTVVNRPAIDDESTTRVDTIAAVASGEEER
ncbi:MAG: hypothetical protein JNK05_31730 [Myxococcales bacterium]|nr:hypothetical protein [Myxococcales bacterium]